MILSAHGLGRKGKEKNLETARKPSLFIHRGAVARTITPFPSRAGEATFCKKRSSSVPNHVTASQGKESPQLRAGPVPTTAEHQPTCSARQPGAVEPEKRSRGEARALRTPTAARPPEKRGPARPQLHPAQIGRDSGVNPGPPQRDTGVSPETPPA